MVEIPFEGIRFLSRLGRLQHDFQDFMSTWGENGWVGGVNLKKVTPSGKRIGLSMTRKG